MWILLLLMAVSTEHQLGLDRYAAKDYAGAIEAFRKALAGEAAGSKEFGESQLLLGQSLYLTGKTDEAILALEKASGAEALYMLGQSYLKKRDLNACVGAFGRMYGAAPGSAGAYLVTAQILLRQELNDDAEVLLGKALAMDARLPQVHYLLGELYLFRGEFERGVKEFLTEISISPASALAYYKLGDGYSRLGDWERAIPALQKSVWLNASNSGPFILLGKGYLQRKELGNAEGMLKRAIAMDPGNSSAHYLLGQTLVQEGKVEEGRAILVEGQRLKK